MVSKGEEKFVIYPIYFDKKLSRKEGRKVSKKYAVEKPSVEDILKSAKSLSLNPVLEKGVSHPSRFWKEEGRILVDKKETKTKIIKKIAKSL